MQYTTLIGTEALAVNLRSADWVIFDCRFELGNIQAGERQYLENHIPGARYADLERHLSGQVRAGTGRHPLPDTRKLAHWLGRMGVGNRSQVVAYDAAAGAFAARLWWLLRWLGHEAVAVLDGGWPKWRREQHPVTPLLPDIRPGNFIARPRDEIRAATREVLDIVEGRTSGRIVDARDEVRFAGREEPLDPVAGHVPGAVNMPFRQNTDSNDQFLTPGELRQRFATAGLARAPAGVVHMCGSGVTACHNLLAMEIAGLGGARLYAGSWSEWIQDRKRPVAVDE